MQLSPDNIKNWLKSRQGILVLLLIIAAGSILRIYNLGAESIWLDEVSSISCSSQDVSSIIASAGTTQNQPPLYFIILHFWIALWGTGEVAVRSLSAVFGIVSILLIYQVGSTLFNRRVGLLGGFLSAISSYHIYYSQEVRCYSLLLLLSLLSYLFFIKILKTGRNWYYPCYFMVTLLLGYTHLYSLFIIASQVLFFLLFLSKYKQQRLKLLTSLVVLIIALAPLVLLLGGSAVNIAKGSFWIGEPHLVNIVFTLGEFAGPLKSKDPFLVGPLLVAFVALALCGFLAGRKIDGKWVWKNPLESLKGLRRVIKLHFLEEEVLLIIWLAISIIVPFIESKFMTPIYLTRYMIGASPAFYLLVARGMGNVGTKRVFYPILIFIIVLSSIGLHQYYVNDVKSQWREVATFIETNSEVDGDVAIFCANYIQTPFDYYYSGGLQKYGIKKSITDIQQINTLVGHATLEKDRLWLILGHGGKKTPVHSCLIERYGNKSIILEREFVHISVLLFNMTSQ